ncbi:hypothetical protein HMPREF9418_2673 [Neisseria macacae ATCC 33926]|uniref:Uncharacterized protein n=1 Tax=Neisseria macacae ATCC 33926 TaxID=997348 RepID=A0AA36UHY8_9NEIS|nr:hypothetical protein HMPREF9418_2673 [Neisseria macacae ATCC 33926]
MYSGLTLNQYGVASPCPDLNLIHYTTRTRRALPPCLIFILIHYIMRRGRLKIFRRPLCSGRFVDKCR